MCKSVDSVPLLSVHLAAAVTAPSWLRKLAATFSRIVDVLHADVCEPAVGLYVDTVCSSAEVTVH